MRYQCEGEEKFTNNRRTTPMRSVYRATSERRYDRHLHGLISATLVLMSTAGVRR